MILCLEWSLIHTKRKPNPIKPLYRSPWTPQIHFQNWSYKWTPNRRYDGLTEGQQNEGKLWIYTVCGETWQTQCSIKVSCFVVNENDVINYMLQPSQSPSQHKCSRWEIFGCVLNSKFDNILSLTHMKQSIETVLEAHCGSTCKMSQIFRTVYLIYFTWSRSVAEDPRKCSVDFGAFWKHNLFNFDRQWAPLCAALGAGVSVNSSMLANVSFKG